MKLRYFKVYMIKPQDNYKKSELFLKTQNISLKQGSNSLETIIQTFAFHELKLTTVKKIFLIYIVCYVSKYFNTYCHFVRNAMLKRETEFHLS